MLNTKIMRVLGFGNVMAGLLALLKHKWWEYTTGAMGDTLILWIVIQCVILGTIEFLHIIFFFLGVLLGASPFIRCIKNESSRSIRTCRIKPKKVLSSSSYSL